MTEGLPREQWPFVFKAKLLRNSAETVEVFGKILKKVFYLCNDMLKENEFTDKELGTIRIRINSQARHIILRPQSAGILVTIPPYTSTLEVRQALERFRDSLKKSQRKIERKLIDLHFRIDAPLFKLSLTEGTKERFLSRWRTGEMQIICPPHTSFDDEHLQEWLRKVIEEGLRKQAKQILLSRLQSLAEKHHLPFAGLKITSSKGRWGSCSGTKHINLSYFLLLLPVHLIDYVMLHELSHTVEMNHGTHFWALLNQLTNGKAHSLRNELRQFSPSF